MNDDERRHFEAHIARTGRYTDWTKTPDGTYQKPRVQDAWEAWQARAALALPASVDAQIGHALIATGLYDRMSDMTDEREPALLIAELIKLVDPILLASAGLGKRSG